MFDSIIYLVIPITVFGIAYLLSTAKLHKMVSKVSSRLNKRHQ
jgi:hypothetical protein